MDISAPVSTALAKGRPRHFVLVWVLRLLRIAGLVYLGVCVVMFSIQGRFVFPGSATQGQRDAIIYPGVGYELLSLSVPHGGHVAALFGNALQSDGTKLDDPRARPTVIYFYGNGACMAYSTDVFVNLRRLGMNVIVAEYEGYGMSPGTPSETGCYAAADAAYDYLLGRNDIDPKRIVAMGWSLGGAVAIDLASRRPIAGLITISAFTSLRAVGHQIFPWLPMSLILKYRFDNVDKLAGISCPILLIHGKSDELVPFWMEGELAKAARGKVTIHNVAGAGHNDVFDRGGEYLIQEIGAFLEQFADHKSETRPS